MALWDMFTKRAQPVANAGAAPPAASPDDASPAGAQSVSASDSTSAAGPQASAAATAAQTSAQTDAQTAAATDTPAAQADTPAQASGTPPRPTPLSLMRTQSLAQQAAASPPPTDALNSQVVQAVQLTNSETASYAASQVATAPDMMISQASGLVAQSAANYFDGVSKLALASQAVLLKKMTEDIAKENLPAAAEDALGALATDLLMAAAAAVAAAAGAIEAESASFAIDKIDQSIARYSQTLANRKAL